MKYKLSQETYNYFQILLIQLFRMENSEVRINLENKLQSSMMKGFGYSQILENADPTPKFNMRRSATSSFQQKNSDPQTVKSALRRGSGFLKEFKSSKTIKFAEQVDTIENTQNKDTFGKQSVSSQMKSQGSYQQLFQKQSKQTQDSFFQYAENVKENIQGELKPKDSVKSGIHFKNIQSQRSGSSSSQSPDNGVIIREEEDQDQSEKDSEYDEKIFQPVPLERQKVNRDIQEQDSSDSSSSESASSGITKERNMSKRKFSQVVEGQMIMNGGLQKQENQLYVRQITNNALLQKLKKRKRDEVLSKGLDKYDKESDAKLNIGESFAKRIGQFWLNQKIAEHEKNDEPVSIKDDLNTRLSALLSGAKDKAEQNALQSSQGLLITLSQKHSEQRKSELLKRYSSVDEMRIIRWVCDTDEKSFFEDEEEKERELERKTRGTCGWLKRCFYDCKSGKEIEHDIQSVNIRSYFEQLSSTLDTKIEKDREAIKNWQKLNLRLALFRNLRSKVKEQQNKCVCFEKRYIQQETNQPTNKTVQSKKVKQSQIKNLRHDPDCYLYEDNIADDLNRMEVNPLAFSKTTYSAWWQKGDYVINPESITLQVWYVFTNLLYLFSLFTTSLIIAFRMQFLQRLQILENIFDAIMLIDIILVFFTAVELPPSRWKSSSQRKDQKADVNAFTRYEYNMIKIAKSYITKFLVFDLLACLPTLITLNQRSDLFLLKLFKFMQTIRIYDQIKVLMKVLIKKFHHHQVRIVNLITILKATIALMLFIHVITCGWIIISVSNPTSWIYTMDILHIQQMPVVFENWAGEGGFNEYLNEIFGPSQIEIVPIVSGIYINCFYFTTTTMTAVGYGDIKGWTQYERLYLIAVAFSSLYLVSFIRSSVLNLMQQDALQDIVRNTKFDVEDYLHRVDKTIADRKIQSQYYDKISDYVLRQMQFSQRHSFQDNKYYKNLPPRLKNRLVEETLRGCKRMFYFFFHDVVMNLHADPVFIRKVVSGLDFRVMMPGSIIVHAGQPVKNVYFVQSNHVLISDLFLRFHIVKLGQRSFFGEHEVLYDVPSQFTYSTGPDKANSTQSKGTELFTLSKDKMRRYCEDFPDFAFYIRERATLRRALWRKIELEYEESLAKMFYEAEIIKENDIYLDPLHLNDYRDWVAGHILEDPITQQLRHVCIQNTTTLASRLKDPKFNPNAFQSRPLYLRDRYTALSKFQQQIILSSLQYSLNFFEMETLLTSAILVTIPNVRLKAIYSQQFLDSTFKSWRLFTHFEKQRFDLRMFKYQPFILATTYDYSSMVHQSSLLLRNKVNYKRQFASLILIEDTDDEEQMEEFFHISKNKTTVEIPRKLLKSKTLRQPLIRDEQELPELGKIVAIKSLYIPSNSYNGNFQKQQQQLAYKHLKKIQRQDTKETLEEMFDINIPEVKVNVTKNQKDQQEQFQASPSLKVNVSLPSSQRENKQNQILLNVNIPKKPQAIHRQLTKNSFVTDHDFKEFMEGFDGDNNFMAEINKEQDNIKQNYIVEEDGQNKPLKHLQHFLRKQTFTSNKIKDINETGLSTVIENEQDQNPLFEQSVLPIDLNPISDQSALPVPKSMLKEMTFMANQSPQKPEEAKIEVNENPLQPQESGDGEGSYPSLETPQLGALLSEKKPQVRSSEEKSQNLFTEEKTKEIDIAKQDIKSEAKPEFKLPQINEEQNSIDYLHESNESLDEKESFNERDVSSSELLVWDKKKNRQQNRPKSKADRGRNNNDKLAEAYSPFDKKRVSHNGDRLAPTSSIFDKKNSSITSASLSQIKPTFEQTLGVVYLQDNMPIQTLPSPKVPKKRKASRLRKKRQSQPINSTLEKRTKVSEFDRNSTEDQRDKKKRQL